ncbi:solute carrier family 40 member 3, chloroplastic isoform X2 [Amborella trichopoda]|uniref:Solute carrier family 40 member n=1 Tax=Amborella trichopoda TaxID=13333 RepID=W1P5B4_AMBTC|nr:solute carrier family 40 member 3, chloroplastic isoform X2 [Amborella trichopoda]ERN03118.1 hypothetical protein AMTR_s00003p00071730 [Amborella trichopoda]|eukprot:XP_006841443.1 solute carrier family 40 member 3, chloroplastic isoform X2 [Amborella trichopoda]
MGLDILLSHPSAPYFSRHLPLSNPRPTCCLHSRLRLRLRPSSQFSTLPCFRINYYSLKCYLNADVEINNIATEDDITENLPSIPSGCSIPVVHLDTELLENESLQLLNKDSYVNSLWTALPVLTKEEQDALDATPAHPAGLYALYASFLAGNLVEQIWNFAWPSTVALLHPSLLPVAVVSFFTKLAIFVGGPLVGNFMDSFPRLLAFNYLSLLQTAAQLLSAAMIIYALNTAMLVPSATSLLLQPWFIVLVLAGAIERLTGLATGIAFERDWVVLLAGTNRPIALAQANAMLSRIDLLCEIAGAAIFGVLLSKYDTITCLKLAAGLMILTLPVLLLLVWVTNRLSKGVLSRPKFPCTCGKLCRPMDFPAAGNLVERVMDSIKHGWFEYRQQPVLPASLAYVLLYFNVVLAPGGLMTSFLTQQGLNPSIIGGFSSMCAFMGVAATFISAGLVKRLGILKAGAAGLIFQASLLTVAVAVYWSGSLSHQKPLLFFLCLIVLSRLGHMSYDVVGSQILQTGIPASKANLIGTTEVSIASFAEFVMLGVAIIANDVSHFGFLAMLSVASVVGAACMFCRWLANPTDEQRKLFSLF